MNFVSKLLPTVKRKIVLSVVSVLALFVLVGFVAYEVTKEEVYVTNDGETETVITHANTVEDLLEELDIVVGDHDELSHDLEEPIVAEMHVEYVQAQRLTLIVDQEEEVYYTTQESVAEFLDEVEVEVSEHDELSVELSTPIEDDLAIELNQAVKVIVDDAGEKEEVWTTEKTIANLLEEQSIELNDLDRLEPAKDEELTDDLTVTITRVEQVTDVIEETIDFSTVRRNDSSLEKGTEEVIASGSNGKLEKKYQVTLENGEEVDRELVSEEVKEESEQRVIAVGTKVIQNTAATTVSRGDSSTKKTMYVEATAYNWDCGSCSGTGRTATGYNVKANPDGVIAVDPDVIPLGTRVYVEGYGYAVARDTGGAIRGKKIDLHMRTVEEARQFGRQQVKIEILD
ncbi:uncharacterized protein YabE (DUF348 family) [Natronobacillus azotifigens]|uniref:Ubiquitin-like domain-containing protein n=1 Tax=Natronobacillus azotifigens TaxID=472978 RepID=A0A9J6RD54_9BACI|nr:ubiquitin-like domain-containing protein [Natronobacillus azotifigens]MCZ0703616.1 ubiquitin-like domain-containing protein [Natronobacillus azotifigens]